MAAPLWVLAFAVLSGAVLGALGMIAGLWSEKFDQLAAFQNFLIMPLTMLSGVFYSIHSLPAVWQTVSHYNPVFYMIDGFRYGFTGHAEGDLLLGGAMSLAITLALCVLCWSWLNRGYKLKA